MRNEALPAPMTIAARAWTVSGTAVARMLRDLLAAAQVLGVAALQAAEVDDAPHAGGARGPREGLGARAVALREVAVAAAHGVHEVVGDVDAVERGASVRSCEDVALDDLGPLGQRGAARVAREAADVAARAAAARARGGRRRSRWRR